MASSEEGLCAELLVAMQGLTFELNTPHDRMMTTLLAGIAQFERDLLSERVKSGFAAAARRTQVLWRLFRYSFGRLDFQ